jgi:hypothetical protein
MSTLPGAPTAEADPSPVPRLFATEPNCPVHADSRGDERAPARRAHGVALPSAATSERAEELRAFA